MKEGAISLPRSLPAVSYDRATITSPPLGGPDGLDDTWRLAYQENTISLGSFTWPRQLVRMMITEQLYRATMILTNHPYHRI